VQDHSPAFVFDLDGTLVDSVYPHVMAWRLALAEVGIELSVWRIHRRIGMSGGLLVDALRREVGRDLTRAQTQELQQAHAAAFREMVGLVRPLPGAVELLDELDAHGVPWAIATSGLIDAAHPALALLGDRPDAVVVTRDEVAHAKPDPDLFLRAAEKLGVAPTRCMVVGDSVWDLLAARRAGSLGVGVLSGGYGRDELERAGAYRVFDDPAELLWHIDELGVRRNR
jgi:HAD superfamily hydrolase (TIGR01509 family)